MQPTSSPIKFPLLLNSSHKPATKQDPHSTENTDFNKENSDDTIHPYSDCEVIVPFSPYDHRQFNLVKPTKSRANNFTRILQKIEFPRLDDEHSVSSLEEHRQLNSRKRPSIDSVQLVQNTKKSRFKKSSSVSPAEKNHPSDSLKRAVNDEIKWLRKHLMRSCTIHTKNDSVKSNVKKRSPGQSSSFLSQSPGGRFGYTISSLASPLTRLRLKEQLGTPLKVLLNKRGSPTKALTKDGTKLRRSAKTAAINTYTATATKSQRCGYVAAEAKAKASISPTYSPLTRLEGFIILDKIRLEAFFGVRKKWSTTQAKVMGMTATEAARAAGVTVEGEFHWLHLFAFSMGGQDGLEPNEEQNLIIGSAGSNGFHLRMEDTIKNLVKKHDQIYVRYFIDPNQTEFDAKWHLCGNFTYEFGLVNKGLVEDYRTGKVKENEVKGDCLNLVTIDTLDTRFSSVTDYTLLVTAAEVAIERSIAKSFASSKDIGETLSIKP
ncbi:MAG: rhsC2 [Solimicrobium sp.]|nr:rhsC2 [Solimicrobium sp.]